MKEEEIVVIVGGTKKSCEQRLIANFKSEKVVRQIRIVPNDKITLDQSFCKFFFFFFFFFEIQIPAFLLIFFFYKKIIYFKNMINS